MNILSEFKYSHKPFNLHSCRFVVMPLPRECTTCTTCTCSVARSCILHIYTFCQPRFKFSTFGIQTVKMSTNLLQIIKMHVFIECIGVEWNADVKRKKENRFFLFSRSPTHIQHFIAKINVYTSGNRARWNFDLRTILLIKSQFTHLAIGQSSIDIRLVFRRHNPAIDSQ